MPGEKRMNNPWLDALGYLPYQIRVCIKHPKF